MASNPSPWITNPGNLPTTFRVGGSGFTAFHWAGQVIGWAQSVGHTSPRPVADPVPIQPLDQQYPMQIITPQAVGPGTLQLQMFELYNTKVWDQIMNVTDTQIQSDPVGTHGRRQIYSNLAEIFQRLSAINTPISCYKIIYPPNTGIRGGGGTKTRKYADKYYGVAVVDVRDDEIIQIGTMEVVKNMTLMYTYSQRIAETTSNL